MGERLRGASLGTHSLELQPLQRCHDPKDDEESQAAATLMDMSGKDQSGAGPRSLQSLATEEVNRQMRKILAGADCIIYPRCPSGYDANGWAMTTWPVCDDGRGG
eukprot:COSAG02_NODE_145_length_34010_cov_7.359696_6_plen_105_part_00